MKLFRRTLRSIYLPLVALIIAIQALAVVHEVRHDLWGSTNDCPICNVASHATAPTPVAPVIATVAAYVFVTFAPAYEPPRLAFVAPSRQPRAPPAAVL
jgi:hypothetical protein